MEPIRIAIDLAACPAIEIETGRLARQADGAVVLRCGDTMLLATVVAKKEINPEVDFLPLSVDYMEKYSSAGKIPGGFIKRDGRLNEHEILVSRLIDRSLRPLFPEDYHAEIQVIVTLISSAPETPADALATVAATAAIMVSDIPFPDPVATVRVGYKDGEFLINPGTELQEMSEMDLIIAGTADSIVMVEGEMKEISEELMLEAFQVAHQYIKQLNAQLIALRKLVNKPIRTYTPAISDPLIAERVKQIAVPQLEKILAAPTTKQERAAAFEALRNTVKEQLTAHYPEYADEKAQKLISRYYSDEMYYAVRRMVIERNIRLDGRRPDEIRPIWCEVSYLPRAHGSAIFTRGETQSLTTITLGTKLDEQLIDYATIQGSKRFMLQYNFPPFSTGEAKMLRAPSRREVGHGNLAERALKMVMPESDYTIRVVSDILESNGSSSMATVCAGTMALLDGGVPLKAPVSGIAMGLIYENGKFVVLSDILGDEDHLGDMDFKVTGSEKGLTACQMDIKVRGLSYDILRVALEQSKQGRLYILNKMLETISEPKPDYSKYAPRLIKIQIPADKIGAVIGPGGKIIQEIQRLTNTTITIEEEGKFGIVTIASPDKASLVAAEDRIKAIAIEPEIGTVYIGKVKTIREAGAFIEFLPGRDGWLHISEVSHSYLKSMEDAVEVGDEIEVQYIGLDPKTNRFRLSRKSLLPEPENINENNGGGGGQFRRTDNSGNRGRSNDRNNNNRGRSDYRGERNDRGFSRDRNERNDRRRG